MTKIICPYCEQDYVWQVDCGEFISPEKRQKICFECQTVWNDKEDVSDKTGIGIEHLIDHEKNKFQKIKFEKIRIITQEIGGTIEDNLVSLSFINGLSLESLGCISGGKVNIHELLHKILIKLREGKLRKIPEELIDDLLRTIDDSDLEITPEQRAILERHASPSPPPNFSP